MAHLFSKVWKTALSGFIILIMLSACLPLTPVSPDTTPLPMEGTSTSLASTPTQGEPSASSEEDLTFGPGSFDLTEPEVGLADLASYKATLTITFNGTQDGKTKQWTKTYIMLSTKEPPSRQLTIEKSGENSDPDAVYMAEMSGVAYERRGQSACMATVIDPENSLEVWMEPAGFLIGVIGAQADGSEMVNGVDAEHYTFDERALGLQDIVKSTGEMWVASEEGFIIKYLLTIIGNEDYFGEGIDGTLTLDYEVTGMNQPVAFALTGDCPAGMVNASQLPDASNVQNMPDLLTYDTSSNLADAAAFYQQQIPNLGWTLLGNPSVTDTTALLNFSQEEQMMSIIIITGDGSSKVYIVLGSLQGEVPTP